VRRSVSCITDVAFLEIDSGFSFFLSIKYAVGSGLADQYLEELTSLPNNGSENTKEDDQ
jgi:hypothetical protein